MKNLKDNKIFKFLTENFQTVLVCTFMLQICDFISILLFKKSFFVVHIVLFSIVSFLVLGFKDLVKDKEKKLSLTIFKISIAILILSLVNGLFSNAYNMQNRRLGLQIYKMSYFLDVGLIIFVFSMFKHEKVQEFFKNLESTNILETVLNKGPEIKPGDAVLGKNIDTGKPVVLPAKDRFLHMLILGPTGSGKTSQTIIPMIYRDMQNKDVGITVIEPKGDLAEKVYAMALTEDREVQYFNPILPSCPYFNPLYGDESDVIENLSTTFRMFSVGSSQYFLDMNDNLVRRAVKLLKRLYGNDATLLHLDKLIHNTGDEGRKMVIEFSRLNTPNPSIASENSDIAKWFLDDYLAQNKQGGCSKTFENTSGVRSQVAKLVSNKYLRKVLNPPAGVGTEIDFDKALEKGSVITVATAQGALRDLGKFLGLFIILQLESAVFRRPGNEDTRKYNFLYIDEFQSYANPGFADMLTQGRSYRVASHLATQNRALIGMGSGQEGKDFIELVSTNARNLIIYPGGNSLDAKYYSDQFGTMMKTTENKTYAKKRFWGKLSDHRVSTAIKEEEVARFTPNDIIYRPFGQITYCLMNKNSIGTPGVSQIEYIPMELNKKLDKMVAEYNAKEKEKALELEKQFYNGVETNDSDVPEEISDNAIIKSPEIPDEDSETLNEDSSDIIEATAKIPNASILKQTFVNDEVEDDEDDIV